MDKYCKYKYDDLFNPVIKALKNLGGSGAISEIEEQVIEILQLSEDEVDEIHRESTTKLSYRLAWARNYLKRFGLLENSGFKYNLNNIYQEFDGKTYPFEDLAFPTSYKKIAIKRARKIETGYIKPLINSLEIALEYKDENDW